MFLHEQTDKNPQLNSECEIPVFVKAFAFSWLFYHICKMYLNHDIFQDIKTRNGNDPFNNVVKKVVLYVLEYQKATGYDYILIQLLLVSRLK